MPGFLLKQDGSVYGSSTPGFAGIGELYIDPFPESLTPGIGSTEEIANGNFASWAAGNPSSWFVAGESGSDPEVSQVGSGEGHGGVGTGLCNLYTSAGTLVQIYQFTLVPHTFYRTLINIDTIVAGGVRIYLGDTDAARRSKLYNTVGSKSFILRANTQYFYVSRLFGATNVTFDNISCKEVTNTYSTPHNHSNPLSCNLITMTLASDSQAGVWHRHAASGDEVLTYIDSTTGYLWLLKKVGGTTSELGNVAQAVQAGWTIKLEHYAVDSWRVFYDTPTNINQNMATALIDVTNVTDANLDLTDQDGYYATHGNTTFLNYKLAPG